MTNESNETYTVAQIRMAFTLHANPDDWGVKRFHEASLISALRGEYDAPRPRFPEGTPEYAEYAAKLREELAKFSAGEPPYNV